MHADNGGVDHLNSGIMGSGKCVYDAAPDTSPPPAYESVVASGVWAKRLRQITPGCSGSQHPEDAIEDTTVVYPRNATRLVRQHRLDRNPFIIGEFVAHIRAPSFGSLNHKGAAKRNAPGPTPVRRLRAEADINLPTSSAEPVENDPTRTPSVHCSRLIFKGGEERSSVHAKTPFQDPIPPCPDVVSLAPLAAWS
jgi:hypothetical protein